jgi:7-cyano-7-deazaguanine reductase
MTGRDAVMSDQRILETFANPAPSRDYVIEHVAEEFTSVCPKTGHPDFAIVTLRYVPDRLCVELKSLKLYYQGYRDEGIFYEAVTNRICDDLVAVLKPRWLEVQTDWRGRGGIRSRLTAAHRGPEPRRRASRARRSLRAT